MQEGTHQLNRVRCSLGMLLAAVFAQTASALPTSITETSGPTPVAKFIERSESCMHFAGEFNGDGSARDVEVSRRMDELRCNALPHDLQTLRKRYRTDTRISVRLEAFDEDGMPRDAQTGP